MICSSRPLRPQAERENKVDAYYTPLSPTLHYFYIVFSNLQESHLEGPQQPSFPRLGESQPPFGFNSQSGGPGPGPNAGPGPGQGTGPSGNFGYLDRIANQKKLEEAKDVDFSADIHGGLTLENSKSHLHQYLQATRQRSHCEYKYTTISMDHNRFAIDRN